MKPLDALITKQIIKKNLQCTVAENIHENPRKIPVFKKLPFFMFFPNFLSNGIFERVEVFSAVISETWRFIGAIKQPLTTIFIFFCVAIMGFCNFSDPWYQG